MHTKTREYRTARRICVARVPGWILTTRHSLTLYVSLSTYFVIFWAYFFHSIPYCFKIWSGRYYFQMASDQALN